MHTAPALSGLPSAIDGIGCLRAIPGLCLRTRAWPDTRASLVNLVTAAGVVPGGLSGAWPPPCGTSESLLHNTCS